MFYLSDHESISIVGCVLLLPSLPVEGFLVLGSCLEVDSLVGDTHELLFGLRNSHHFSTPNCALRATGSSSLEVSVEFYLDVSTSVGI